MTRPWTVHSEKPLYESPWLEVGLADVETPSGRRIDHHIVRVPAEGAGAVVVDEQGRVLLIHRHRFIIGRWGWELPAGRVDPGEIAETTARREVLEETGWAVEELAHLASFHTSPGLTDQVSHVFHGESPSFLGGDLDPDEADEIRWFSREEIFGLFQENAVTDAFTLCGLLVYLSPEKKKHRIVKE